MTATTNNPSEIDNTGENETFGPYEVFERLGVGGMATVHRAKERGIEGFERIVALKRLLPHLAEDASFVRSFVREAKLASLLRHANIVQLYELGRVDAVYFIAMELIEGRDVRKLLRQARRVTGPPPMSVFISLMAQLCDALHYAHMRKDDQGQALGIVHRDVSPSNLIITDSGHLKIIDFGIAKAQTEQLRTQTGRIKGKLAYMAPEAIRGHELDARSDVWAAGVIAHELLTARPLFASKNEYQTLMRVQSSEIAPPSKYNEDVPSEVDDVVLMALARDPAERWQTAAEFRDGLEYVRSQYQLSSTPGDVAEWMTWAFSQKGQTTSSFGALGSTSQTLTPSSMSAPERAFARARERALTSTTMKAMTAEDIDGAQSAQEQAEAEIAAARKRRASSLGMQAPESVLESVLESVSEGVSVSAPERSGSAPVPTPRPQTMGPEEEEAAADYAWGNQEQDESKPILLDEVPDVSSRVPAISSPVPTPAPVPGSTSPVPSPHTGPTPAPAHVSEAFGSGIVAESQERNRTGLIIAVCLAAALAGVLAYFLVIRSGAKKTAAVEAVATTGVLKFRVEPANATIAVLGYGKHSGTPYELEVDAPGLYSIEISADGYKTYVTEFQVEAGVKQILAVGLQEKGSSDQAQVKLESTPAGKRIFLDDQDTGKRTPYTLEMAPGKHVLSLRGEGGDTLWMHEFVADLDKQYVFQPSVENQQKLAKLEEDKKKRERRPRRARSSSRSSSRRGDDGDSDGKTPTTTRIDTGEEDSASGPVANLSGNGLSQVGSGGNTIAAPEVKKPEKPVAKPVEKPVAKPEVKKPANTKPVNILPREAKKVSGDMPTVHMRNPPKVGAAKLCIDTRGKVTKVSVLSKLSSRAKSDVADALKKWRYRTHRVDGVPTPACFAVNFRIKK